MRPNDVSSRHNAFLYTAVWNDNEPRKLKISLILAKRIEAGCGKEILTVAAHSLGQGVSSPVGARTARSECRAMVNWNKFPPELQLALSSEALNRARLIVGAQAQMLAEQMDRGSVPNFDGPDALRLLSMILSQDDTQSLDDRPYVPAPIAAPVLA